MNNLENISAICFGETLFDLLPSGKVPGGAPMNVAVHLQNLGVPTAIVSKVGRDAHGKELIEFLQKRGVWTDLLQVDAFSETGTVKVRLDSNKNATYEIVGPVAWDSIDKSFLENKIKPKYLVHGSLACRSEASKNALLELIQYSNAKIVFDLNLRAPHYDQFLIDRLLTQANIVKMNEEEFNLVKGWLTINEPTLDQEFEVLGSIYKNLEILIVTMGSNGALAWADHRLHSCLGFTVEVEDTIGSGDAFLAAFIGQYEAGVSIPDALEFASATGAYVASRPGANPQYDSDEIYELIKNQR